ncbi:MAG: hypothetical protein NWF04_01635 [Candidatus Bathyarchaeota archaeon]|nr:hypothetical protein [Candidatus Bathyarchaeota archaeon]
MKTGNTTLELKQNPKKYDQYGLKSNPFPYVGIPDEKLPLYVSRKKEMKMVEAVIKSSLNGTSSHIILIGSYGNGKTHTMKYIKKQLEQQVENALAIYLATPGERVLTLYSNFMFEFGFERLEKLVWQFLEYATGEQNLRKKVNEGEVLLPEILEIGKRRLQNEIKYTDFATAFLKMTLEECKFVAWKYLCGEPIPFDHRRELDVVMAIDNDERALRAFMSLKQILSLMDNRLICLLIDEFEAIENVNYLLKQKILNSIRHLIDLNPQGLCLIIACAPDVWVDIIKEYHAFSERIFRQITLKALNKEDLKKFIVSYLDYYRISPDNDDANIFPFTDDALTEIHKVAEGNVRRMLMICNQAIDMGIEMGSPTLNGTTIRELLPDVFEVFE